MINWDNLEIQEEHKIHLVRSLRNKLLQESDWTQLEDSVVDKVAWAEYRQALRDLPTQSDDAEEIVFPNKPEGDI